MFGHGGRCRWGEAGDQGTVFSASIERGEREGTSGGRGGAVHCGPQYCTVSTGDGAGDVFVEMLARTPLSTFNLIFGV